MAGDARLDVAGFMWDDGNRTKCQKHGVSLAEIEQIFRNDPMILPDRTGSLESRFNAVGANDLGRYVFVVFTFREASKSNLIRPLSARYMHHEEIKAYERTRRR